MCEHCECQHSLGPDSYCAECERQKQLGDVRNNFGPVRDNENTLPKNLEEYRIRVRDLAYRLKNDQFITVRVDLLRDLLFTK